MADIELVIKMPEEVYNIISRWDDKTLNWSEMILKYATPIPKEHGRIVDIDKVLEEMKATRTYDIPFALERVEPIIEARKEQTDGKDNI